MMLNFLTETRRIERLKIVKVTGLGVHFFFQGKE